MEWQARNQMLQDYYKNNKQVTCLEAEIQPANETGKSSALTGTKTYDISCWEKVAV